MYGFFSAWFPDADLEGLTDDEVVKEYLKTISPEEAKTVAAECEALLSQAELPLDRIAETACRKFDTRDEARAWLESIAAGLQSGST